MALACGLVQSPPGVEDAAIVTLGRRLRDVAIGQVACDAQERPCQRVAEAGTEVKAGISIAREAN